MMTDQNTAVLEVSVEEKGVISTPQSLQNDAPTVKVIRTKRLYYNKNNNIMFL